MKRYLVAVLITLVLIGTAFIVPGKSNAFMPPEYAEYGDVMIADGIAMTRPGFLYSFVVMTDGTSGVTVAAYDNATEASGASPFPIWYVTTSSIDRDKELIFNPPIFLEKGLYIDFTCGGTFKAMAYRRYR